MKRIDWLKKMREMAEALYDRFAPEYWVTFGLDDESAVHHKYLQKFLERVAKRTGGEPAKLLSAGCGAGRWDGVLVEPGHFVLGIDQSTGMLARAREHYPAEQYLNLHYEKIGLQEIAFEGEFDGVTCVDALEHVCPEDYPQILNKFHTALKPGGMLYFTVDNEPWGDLETAYQNAKAQGLPVVFGEVVDQVNSSYDKLQNEGVNVPVEVQDSAVYHYHPDLEEVREWLKEAGLTIEAEGPGSGYYHFMCRK